MKKSKNNVHQVRLIEKLQKAIMIVRMCRPLILAASKHRKSCGSLCLHCVDLSMPSGSGWALRVLNTVDIHTHGADFIHPATVAFFYFHDFCNVCKWLVEVYLRDSNKIDQEFWNKVQNHKKIKLFALNLSDFFFHFQKSSSEIFFRINFS